jgi:hypothetical protein
VGRHQRAAPRTCKCLDVIALELACCAQVGAVEVAERHIPAVTHLMDHMKVGEHLWCSSSSSSSSVTAAGVRQQLGAKRLTSVPPLRCIVRLCLPWLGRHLQSMLGLPLHGACVLAARH